MSGTDAGALRTSVTMVPAMDAAMVTDKNREVTVDVSQNRYVPVPANGKVCPISGLKHAHLYRLLLHGPAAKHVRVVNLREPGASRGKTLFHAGDFLRWLDCLAESQRQSGGNRPALR